MIFVDFVTPFAWNCRIVNKRKEKNFICITITMNVVHQSKFLSDGWANDLREWDKSKCLKLFSKALNIFLFTFKIHLIFSFSFFFFRKNFVTLCILLLTVLCGLEYLNTFNSKNCRHLLSFRLKMFLFFF